MNNQVNAQLELEISASVIQRQLERLVASIDLPLIVPGVLPIRLGRLTSGRIEGFAIDPSGVRISVGFERGRKTPVRIEMHLSEISFARATQTLTLTLGSLNLTGLTPLSALVNPLRGQLVSGAVRTANQRVEGLLSTKNGGIQLELHLDALIDHALRQADSSLRAALETLLPIPAKTVLHASGLELRVGALWLQVRLEL